MRFPVYAMAVLVSVFAGCARHPDPGLPPHPVPLDEAYPYTKPLTSMGAKFAALPGPVQNTVRAQVGMTEIADIFKKSTSDQVYYIIYFRDAKNFPPLYLAPDGSVLRPDLTVAVPAPQETGGGLGSGPGTTVTIKDLPPPVVRAIQDRTPNADLPSVLASMKKETWGDHVVYTVSFKEEAHLPTLHLVADGRVLEHVPAPAAKAP